MNRIWANRLEAGTQEWSSVPSVRRDAVLAVLRDDVAVGRISAARLAEIIGEENGENSAVDWFGQIT